MASISSMTVYIGSWFPGLPEAVREKMAQRGYSQHKIVVCPTVDEDVSSFPMKALDDEFLNSEIHNIKYLIADPPVIAQILTRPDNRLLYAQNTIAGVDRICQNQDSYTLHKEFRMVRFGGKIFAQMMGEYVIGTILERERKWWLLHEYQKQRKYNRSGTVPFRTFDKLSIAVLGVGRIGKEVLRLCKAFRSMTWAVVRDERLDKSQECHVDNADNVCPISRLHEVLSNADYLVNLLPSTPQTRGLLSGEVLRACQAKKTIFVNLGRGDVIDEPSLVKAISEGWIGGAILDVQSIEPLPENSQLWTLPGVKITPHNSCCVPDVKAVAEDYVDNLVNLITGAPISNLVDLAKGY